MSMLTPEDVRYNTIEGIASNTFKAQGLSSAEADSLWDVAIQKTLGGSWSGYEVALEAYTFLMADPGTAAKAFSEQANLFAGLASAKPIDVKDGDTVNPVGLAKTASELIIGLTNPTPDDAAIALRRDRRRRFRVGVEAAIESSTW